MEEFESALVEMETLVEAVKSAILGSVSSKGNPLCSYAPVYVDEERRCHVYISSMAKHTSQIRRSGKASVMLIEDESVAENLFARKRLTVDCEAMVLERDSDAWLEGIAAMEERHGETMQSLKTYVDFDLFQLKPIEGRLVLGFGKSYRVFGPALQKIDYVGGGGHHTK
ncbi:MAG: pyridoxamine 5'-phosphate oxidase family protein [Opitutaceae bacterium]|nr:pyridoxamine 5'-phosphate oxidase family protein [Opitutaceae bacterium]